MPDPPTRGRQGRAYDQAELEALLRAALSELMADGTPFRDLSVNRIVGAAGVARSTFYLSYADKAALLRSLSAASLQRLYGGARTWIRLGDAATLQDIADGMRQILEDFREDEVVMRAVAEASAYEPTVREAYERGVLDYAGALEKMIRRGVRSGAMREVDPGPTALTLAWMTEGVVRHVAATTPDRHLDAQARALADVVHRTLFS